MPVTPVRIAGTPTATHDAVEIRNPYGGAVVGHVPLCGPDQVDQACRAAAAVLARDDFPQYQRARVLETAAGLLRERVDDFARTITLESAKPIRTARVEATRCVDTLTFAAVEARRLTGEMVADASESGRGKLMFALRVPVGVVAAITPFNFPLNLVAHKLAPAIAAGCPVVVKPAPQTPLSAIKLVELLVEAGMPHDWISVVTDRGTDAAVPLVDHGVPRMITFTGSVEVGWGIKAAAPRKRVALELGSASPVIVAPDADIDALAAKIKVAGFAHAGQSCISVQRVIVHRSVRAAVRDAVAQAAESVVVGDPADEATDMGPLIANRETDRVVSWVEEAVSQGGGLVTGGKVADGILLPTVVDDPPGDTKLCTREVFGPVVVLLPYNDFAEAVRIANASPYGLHAGVFTNDLPTAMRAMHDLDFGGVLINEVPTFRADHQPYGGVRDAGNTREGPAYAVREMTDLRFVSLPSPL